MTTTNSNVGLLRKEHSIFGEVVAEIPSYSSILVFSDFKSPYFKVQYNGIVGFMSFGSIIMNDGLRLIKSERKNNVVTTKKNYSKPNQNSNSKSSSYSSSRKRHYPSRSYIRGPRGGCYYINSNGNKTYVDRSFCK